MTIRTDGYGRISTDQSQQSQAHTQWPCVQHPADVSCDDAIAAFAARTTRTVIVSDEDVHA